MAARLVIDANRYMSAAKNVPEGPMKVAQYEVLGNDAKKMFAPPGTIETFGF